MKTHFIFTLLLPISLFAQKNKISYNSAVYVPYNQQSQIVNYLKLPGQFANSDIQLLPSTYYGGFTYKRELFNSNWSLNFGVMVGQERYNLTAYNDFVDFYQYPEYAAQYEDIHFESNRAILNFGIEKKYKLTDLFDECSLMIGYGLSLNEDPKGDSKISTTINPWPLTTGTELTYYPIEVILSEMVKTNSNLNLGISFRKNIAQKFYLELNGNLLPFNKIKYSYNATSKIINTNGSGEIYNSGKNQVKYNLVSFQFNFGISF